jgi:hypothetical protein
MELAVAVEDNTTCNRKTAATLDERVGSIWLNAITPLASSTMI